MQVNATPSDPSDDQLGEWMRAAQSGDAAAYRQLLRSLTPRIRRIVARRCGFARAADVDDLVQDVLLSVHAVRATYDPSRPFMPWLLAIIRHRLADGARRHARSAAREAHLDDVTFVDPATNSRENARDDLEALRYAVQALPAGQRRAIELLKLQEFSLREAAAASGSTVGALKVAAHRAMAALRRSLAGGTRRS
jgi:RNA polymerase sigma-70 factor (ECF subfamily)